MAAQITETQVN